MPRLCLLANAASSHTEKWAEELASRGWTVDIISFIPAQISNVNIHVVPELLGGKVDILLRIRWVLNKVKELKPDILHAHYATSFGFLGALAEPRPLVISAWGSDVFAFPKSSLIHKYLLKWILKQADLLCSTSKVMAKEMDKYIEPGRKINVIPFGVDVELFSPSQKPDTQRIQSIKMVEQPIVFGVAKYFQPVYGLDLLLKAFAKLIHERNLEARLRIAGDGPERPRLELLAERLKISDKVEWLGAIPNALVATFYKTLDVVVVPSRQESFGVTAVEGSACGLPIIASRVGGLPEVVIDKETGILIEPGNIEELTAAMEYMMFNPIERQQMGQSGRQLVLKHYNWKENVSQMEQVYLRALNRA